MAQMYKVFIKDSSLNFASEATDHAGKWQAYPGLEMVLEQYVRLEKLEGTEHLYFAAKDVEEVWEEFRSNFQIVAAAGGVTRDEHGRILLIHRLGKWDLPKGKIESGEEIAEAASREVEEECGITGLKLGSALPTTFHTYRLKGEAVLKPTYWFEMQASGDSSLLPQLEEQIDEVVWVKPEDLPAYLENTYASIAWLMSSIKS